MIRDIMENNENITTNQKEIAVLREHFPQCFKSDGTFDFARFESLVKDKIDVVHEGYELNFLGKNYAKLITSIDTTTIIQPDLEHNEKSENKNSDNVYISGDNLDGLKHLLKSYSKKVKCIYIDPPYNTGTDGFVYNDKFNFTAQEIEEKLSIDETQAQRIIEMTKRNSASHSAWLMFMYPRLQLARDLLTDEGVIFISIDDNEQGNLKLLCDDVFGEENFVATFPWRKRTAKSDVPFGISQDYEWVICYSRTNSFVACIEGNSRKYFETGDLPNRPWRIHDMSTQRTAIERPNSNFTIVNPKNGNEYPVNPNAVWRVTKETFKHFYEKNRIVFPEDYDFLNISKPVLRYFKEDDEQKLGEMFGYLTVSTNFPKDIGMTQDGTKNIRNLFENKVFSYPKPTDLVKYLIKLATTIDNSAIILDFFSGSATTAHAVMKLNAEDGGNRKYIMIQLQEACREDSEAFKSGYKTIDQIGIERIIRATKKIKEENPDADIDYGFKHFTLCEPRKDTLDKLEKFKPLEPDQSILDDFGRPTILTTWLANDGYGFNPNVTTIDLDGYLAYYCDKHLYFIDPDLTSDGITKLFEKYNTDGSFNPDNIVWFGYSFIDWSINEMLDKNIKLLNDGEKNLKINIHTRY